MAIYLQNCAHATCMQYIRRQATNICGNAISPVESAERRQKPLDALQCIGTEKFYSQQVGQKVHMYFSVALLDMKKAHGSFDHEERGVQFEQRNCSTCG